MNKNNTCWVTINFSAAFAKLSCYGNIFVGKNHNICEPVCLPNKTCVLKTAIKQFFFVYTVAN